MVKRILRTAERIAKSRLPRRIHVLCVGAPKTGTTSLAHLFRGYRSAHEADATRYINALTDRWPVSSTDDHVSRYLRTRDRRCRLEVDSAHMHGVACHQLVTLFPEANFILTIREPTAWFRSVANHHALPLRTAWSRYQDVRFGGYELTPDEVNAGLRYSVRGYLAYWQRHNRTVLDAVPSDKLLVLNVADIPRSVGTITRFTGADRRLMARGSVHLNQARGAGAVDFDALPASYVETLADEICGSVMSALRR